MPYFLGIDAGGSKTAALVGDDQHELGRAEGPSSKIQNVGEAAARTALHDVIQNACANAKISPGDLARVCIGISGASNKEIAERVRQFISEVTPAEVQVAGDNVIALEAAVGSGPGVVVIAGTGSIAYGRNEHGEEARAGGFGPVISDEGSGTWIGKRAIRVVAQSGETESPLARAVMSAWNSHTTADLVSRANSFPSPDFAALFPLVVAACEQRDPLACEILEDAGRELASLADKVMRKLWRRDTQIVPVGVAGGVLQNSPQLRRSFTNALRMAQPNIKVNPRAVEPAAGALAIARRSQ
jgi:N-acetylglucosamine kinase-like BadF-type ATPase